MEDTQIDKSKILSLFDDLKISPLVRTDNNENILLQAFDSVLELQNVIDGK